MSVPPSNVKVYDRPESKRPSPIVIVVVLLVVAIVGFFIYKAMHHEAPVAPTNAPPGFFRLSSVVQQESFRRSVQPMCLLIP